MTTLMKLLLATGGVLALLGGGYAAFQDREPAQTAKLKPYEFKHLKVDGHASRVAGTQTTLPAYAGPAATPPALEVPAAPAAAAPARPAPVVVPAAPARTGGPAAGTYTCSAWMGGSYVGFGTMKSDGGTLDTGVIARAGGTVQSVTPTRTGVTIAYRTARGNNESMDCERQ